LERRKPSRLGISSAPIKSMMCANCEGWWVGLSNLNQSLLGHACSAEAGKQAIETTFIEDDVVLMDLCD